jgi:hypothetical protein
MAGTREIEDDVMSFRQLCLNSEEEEKGDAVGHGKVPGEKHCSMWIQSFIYRYLCIK